MTRNTRSHHTRRPMEPAAARSDSRAIAMPAHAITLR